MGEKRFSKVNVVLLVPDLILSIVCGHILFFRFFLLKKKSKNIENFQKDKKCFILCLVLFVFEDYMNYGISLLIYNMLDFVEKLK